MPRIPVVCVCVGLIVGCTGQNVHGQSALASLFDTPSGANATPGVLDGTWVSTMPIVFTMPTDVSSGPGSHTPHMALHFTPTTITNATQCTFQDGTVIYAGEVAPVQVDARSGTITVLPSTGSEADTESYEVYDCKSTLKPATVHFSINAVSLSISGGPYADGQFVKTSD